MKQNIAILTIAILLVCSCSVKKRHYRKGFYLETKKDVVVKKESKEEIKSIESNESFSASSDDNTIPLLKQEKLTLNSIDTTVCKDTIFLRKGNYIVCKILENQAHHIKYIKCPKVDDSYYFIEKENISRLSNETNNVTKKTETPINYEKEIDPFAVISAISGVGALISAFAILIGVFIFFSLFAIIFGIIGIVSIHNNNNYGIFLCIFGIIAVPFAYGILMALLISNAIILALGSI